MTLQQLIYFEKISDTQNMSRAAEELYITQPSLSVSMRKLEQELTVQLFTHRGHRTLLTREGEIFREHVRRILTETEEAVIHMKRLGAEKRYSIRIGCTTPILCELLPRCMQEFRKIPGNEKTRFVCSTGNTPELIRKLKAGVYDCLICSGSSDPEVLQIPLEKEPVRLITQKGDSVPESWEELLRRPLIGYEENSAMNEFLLEISREVQQPFSFEFRAPNEEAIAALVAHGMGIAIAPRNRSMQGQRIEFHPLPSGVYYRYNCLTLRPGDAPAGAAADRFVQFMSERRVE